MKNRSGDGPTAGSRLRPTGAYVLTIFASVLVLMWTLKLWRADLSIPFMYTGDGLLSASVIKGIIENGWLFHNDFLGAPDRLNFLDYPNSDNVHFAIIKLITMFTGDYAVVMNIFYLATFPLTVLSSLFVFRRFNIAFPAAAVGSILFAFAPYHLWRGEGHLLLSAIYVIPLTVLLIIRLCSDFPPLLRRTEDGGEVFELLSYRTAGFLIIAALTASAGIYYTYFACIFLVALGFIAAYKYRSPKRLAVMAILVGLIAAILLINILPSLIYQQRYGKNETVAHRDWNEAEFYGSTITQLLLPVTGHRVEFLRGVKDDFVRGAYTENTWASLGLVAGAGFLYLLGRLVFRRRQYCQAHDADDEEADSDSRVLSLLDSLSALSLTAILLGTVGGFGLMIAFLISPQMRAYNRISIYISFFCIMGIILLLEMTHSRYFRSKGRQIAYYGILGVVLLGGIFDQTNPGMVTCYDGVNAAYASDKAFFQKIETALPAGSMVFQLPYVPFPESPPFFRMPDYEHLVGYMHTHDIHWSYGAMKGRDTSQWQQIVAGEPVDRMIDDLVDAGFRGVYINRRGYADGIAGIEQELEQALNEKPIVDDAGNLVFFDLSGVAGRSGAET